MDNDLNKEILKNLANKSELERTISVGIQGPPEIKPDEKRHYLGEFRERILRSLTTAQVMRNSHMAEVKEALKDKRSTKMLIRGDIDHRFRDKYQRLASETGKPYTIVHDPDLKGNIGLIIASDNAVDVEDIEVKD